MNIVHRISRTITFFLYSTIQKTVASATRQRVMERGWGSKIRQKARGGSNNVSMSVEEDRGQHNLSTEDRVAVKPLVQSCCRDQPKSKLAN